MSYNEQMTSGNALANAKRLFRALAAGEANLDEPIPDLEITDAAVQIGLEGDQFDSALDYAADQGWFEDAEMGDSASWVSRSHLPVWPLRYPSPTSRQSAKPDASLGSPVGVGGRPSSLAALSSQIWASCRKDTRVSVIWASRAHLKHSSANARYSAAVFMGKHVLQRIAARIRRACLPQVRLNKEKSRVRKLAWAPPAAPVTR